MVDVDGKTKGATLHEFNEFVEKEILEKVILLQIIRKGYSHLLKNFTTEI